MNPKAALRVSATGVSLTLGVASVSAVIPNDSSGTKAKVVRLATSTDCFVRFGATGLTAVATDMLVTAGDAVIVHVAGYAEVAALQGPATGGILIVTPLEAW